MRGRHSAAHLLTLALLAGGCAVAGREPEPARTIELCVIADRKLTTIPAEVSRTGADTLYRGRPFREAFPVTAEYAQDADWYQRTEPLPEALSPHEGGTGKYTMYGPPTQVAPEHLERIGTFNGVAIYAERGDLARGRSRIWVPVRPGCWFRAYQFEGVGDGVERHPADGIVGSASRAGQSEPNAGGAAGTRDSGRLSSARTRLMTGSGAAAWRFATSTE
jgi:hypothetical protein